MYFPLAVGSKWYYRDYYISNDTLTFSHPGEEFDITHEIVGYKEINGKRYAISEEKYFDIGYIRVDTNYYRVEEENLYRYKDIDNQYMGGLLAKFSLAVGDTFQCYSYTHQYIGTIIEKTNVSITIHYHMPGAWDEEFELTFVRNTGLTKEYSTDWRMGKMLQKYEEAK